MILVTGASGHLGRRLVARLLEKGEKVRILVHDKDLRITGVEIIRGDILDVDAVKKATEGADVIYHLAALVDYGPVPKELMYRVNVIGTKNLLDCSNGAKVIYMSSTSVYGSRMRANPATENTPCNPSNYYGKTKLMAERLVLEKGGVALRAPVIYGPGFNDGFDFVLSQIRKGKMRIVGSGKNRIQWVHVDDLVQALVLAKDKARAGEVYLIAGDETKTQSELFSLLAKYLGSPAPSKTVSAFLANSMARYKVMQANLKGKRSSITPDQISRIISDKTFDISKAKRELGFRSKVSYDKGAKGIVEEYLQKTTAGS